MSRTRTRIAAVLTGLVVVALLGGGVTAALDGDRASTTQTATAQTATAQTATAQSTTVTATGAETVTATPDRALVGVAATATGDTPQAATDRLAANVSRLRGALENRTSAVRTTGFDVFERQQNGTTAYVARQAFQIELDDTAAVGDVIDLAVASGATEISGVTFTLSEERRREVRADAIDGAVVDARDQADVAASSAGLSLGDVRSLSVGDGGVAPVQRFAEEGTDIDVSPVTVSATVRVTYNASSA